MTTPSGESAGTMKYYPFGECRNSTGNIATDRLFTGQRLDDTGLYYYGARYYDPTIGRFISVDPIIGGIYYPQSINPYTYCLNNPLKYIDPSGQNPLAPVIGIFIAIAEALGISVGELIAIIGGGAAAGLSYYYINNNVDFPDLNINFTKDNKGHTPEAQARKDEADRLIHDRINNPDNWEQLGKPAEEPATGKEYKGGTSYRQLEQNRKTGDKLEHHWIKKGDRVVHENWKLPTAFFTATLNQLESLHLSINDPNYQAAIDSAYNEVAAGLGPNQAVGWTSDLGYHAIDID